MVIGSGEVTGQIESDVQKILRQLHKSIGNSTVAVNRLDSTPPWLINKALKEEHHNNSVDSYHEVKENMLPKKANVITSHVIYEFKTSEEGEHSMKERIFPLGNKDDIKSDIRKYSATAQFYVIRLLLALATMLRMRLGVVDIIEAYIQSFPINRDINVRPPREWKETDRGSLWKLQKFPYGVSEAERQ